MKLPQLTSLVGGAALAIVACQKADDAPVPGEMSTGTFRGGEIRFEPDVALVWKSVTTTTAGGRRASRR